MPVLTNGFGVDYLEGMARLIACDPALSFDELTSWVDHSDLPRVLSNVALLLALYVQDHALS